ncbi:protein-disulfide reductase DsbD domain-containing protein [Aureimonas altamirensis]|uniref:protein-disulfide reductase DsbD domain-containing protein n=1 Tax=Aureimonas altamirensis TaxID=370622 RepID=UPI00255757DB|nr:protein-disulfide reductase DsbD domain-containing protein [Aureimonas altamirensis]
MKFHLPTALLFTLIAISHPEVAAAEGSAIQVDGATLRLLAIGPDRNGVVRGAVAVDLEPGWKTYWIAPGQAGLAPVVDFSASEGLEGAPALLFPVPHVTDDGFSSSNVYSEPMAIAFTARASGDAPRLDLALTIGLCDDICVPVQARLQRDLAEKATLGETAQVHAAEAALPDIADDRLEARIEGTSLVVTLPPEIPRGPVALFAAGPPGWEFGPAGAPSPADGAYTVVAPVLRAPKDARGGIAVDLLLAAGEYARFRHANPVAIAPHAALR